jgi:hypothetical protein
MYTIDLDQQFIIHGGIRVQGFADGDAATLAFSGPAWLTKVGADGRVTRSKNLDRTAILTVRLTKGSEVNSVFSALHNKDYNSTNGAGVAGTMIKDGQGTTLIEGEESFILGPPDETIAAQPGPREWKIFISKLSGIWGGN